MTIQDFLHFNIFLDVVFTPDIDSAAVVFKVPVFRPLGVLSKHRCLDRTFVQLLV